MFGWIEKLIERRQTHLRDKAWPTLKAICDACPEGYMRGIDRLWMDGGSLAGLRACKKLGWATEDRGYAMATAHGRAFWKANKE